MRELSLHILDLVQNSLAAEATVIKILITESTQENILKIEIIDNGKGIEPEKLNNVLDPFYTSRTTRKVGLGLSLFRAAAEQSGGGLTIRSSPGYGTALSATFRLDDIDRVPLGRLSDLITSLIICNPAVDFRLEYRKDGQLILFDTGDIRSVFSEEDLANPMVISRLYGFLSGLFEEKRQV